MFALLKKRDKSAEALFEAALKAARNPALYRDCGVPDTLDGRFDALLLHLWPIFRALENDNTLSQQVYDFTFKRMELALRETGSGDLAVGRQVREMMKAFYGRLVTYNACESDAEWHDALKRNLYGTAPDVDVPARMIAYARALKAMRVSLDGGVGGIIFPTL